MWIILIKKLPTEVSPPKLSIFWSTPWAHEGFAQSSARHALAIGDLDGYEPTDAQLRAKRRKGEEIEFDLADPTFDRDLFWDGFGFEPNYARARKIIYQGEALRVSPHEFSFVEPANMRLYVLGSGKSNDASHELVASDVASQKVIDGILDGETRPIYEASLLDGCTEDQAMMVALGQDITADDDFGIPPIGWYRCRREYAEFYCSESEMQETVLNG